MGKLLGILRYILRRLLFSLGLILGVSAIIFALINAIGNPLAILIALSLATLIGVTAATRQYTRTDFGVMTGALLGQSLPGFFVGIVLILIFSYWLGIFPSYGAYSTRNMLWGSPLADSLWHMV